MLRPPMLPTGLLENIYMIVYYFQSNIQHLSFHHLGSLSRYCMWKLTFYEDNVLKTYTYYTMQ